MTSITSSSGSIIERYWYDPYGKATVLDSTWAPRITNASNYGQQILHQGGRLESVTGLYTFRNRDYSVSQGRWMRQDPIGTKAGVNLYAYVHDGPLSFADPSGLAGITFAFGFDSSFTYNDSTYRDILRALNNVDAMVQKCCLLYHIGCDVKIYRVFGSLQPFNQPADGQYDVVANTPNSDIASIVNTGQTILAGGGEPNAIPVLITDRLIHQSVDADGFTGRIGNSSAILMSGSALNSDTLAHELGHYTGLDHTNVPYDIMNPKKPRLNPCPSKDYCEKVASLAK